VLTCTVVRVLIHENLLPGETDMDWMSVEAWLVLTAALFVVVAAFEALAHTGSTDEWAKWRGLRHVAEVVSGKSQDAHRRETFTRAGLAVAIASALTLGAALWYSANEIEGASNSVAGQTPPDPSAKPLAQMRDAELIETFMPVLTFSEGQRWRPQRVDRYVELAKLVGPETEDSLPSRCPKGKEPPCYEFQCPSAEDECALTEDLSERKGRYHDGFAYVRIAPVTPFVGPFEAEVNRLLQYWFFYPFDEWRAPVAGGRLVQRHAGDWEAVTIGLGETEPVFAAFSQHCGGRWARWSDVVVADDPGPRTHPLVAVAVGSHANYQHAHEVRPTDWTSCQGVRGEAVEFLMHSWNIRDRTDDDWELRPEWTLVSETTPPMSFPGRWGHEDVTEWKALTTRPLHVGHGPLTPPLQELWTQPIERIFCGRAWRGPEPACDEERLGLLGRELG